MSTKKRTIVLVTALVGWLTLSSCHPRQEILLPDPSNLTIRAAHGAPGKSKGLAVEFLRRSPFPSVDKSLLHEGLCYAEPFYHDAGFDPAGKDTDLFNGIDRGTLFFSATLGTPETWLAMPNGRDPQMCPQSASETHVVNPDRMKLGNGRGVNGDGLRYFWQCASGVFAHGPRQCPAPAREHGCPEGFDGTQDTVLMRNVYERWGGMLSPGIRMACGLSTAAFCSPDSARRVWDLYNRSSNGYAVADAFLEGFRQEREGIVPVCITLGGVGVEWTPLFDAALSTSPNTSGSSHYHAQYPVPFRSMALAGKPAETELPRWAPLFALKPMPLPAALKSHIFEKQDDLLLSADAEEATGLSVRVHPASGALYLVGKMDFDPDIMPLREDQYLEHASRFLQNTGLAEAGAKPEGIRMMIESAPVVNRTQDVIRRQKSVLITFRRHIELDGKTVPVLGDGGLIRLQMNNDGSVFRTAKVWREITGVRKMARVRPYETARGEALQRLPNAGAYRLDGWSWGYKEFEGAAEQRDLKIVYLFSFVPKAADAGLQTGPVQVEIDAQLDMTETAIEK
jgi:hypothetical protein